jgi:hypothetical protein
LTLFRPVHADFLISTLDCLTNFLKLTLSRSVHANFFLAFNILTNFTTSARSTPSQRQTRHLFEIQPNFSEIRTNRSEFGPIVRNSDQSFGIRTTRSAFGPISRKFGPITKIRTNQFVPRSSFVRRFSAINT